MKKSIYDYAIEMNLCSDDDIKKAKKYASETSCTPYKALKDTAVIKENDLLLLMGEIFNYETKTSLPNFDVSLSLLFDSDKLLNFKMIPLENKDVFTVAICNPNSSLAIEDYIKEIMGKNIKIKFILISEETFTKHQNKIGNTIINYEFSEIEDSESDNIYDATDEDISSIVTIVNKIFTEADRMKVSDIHIEPLTKTTRVRFRIDGILVKKFSFPKKVHRQLVNRIKNMANMDVNNSRLPQGGRIRLKLSDKEIDMRVSTLPTINNEKVTVRLLDSKGTEFSISGLCLNEEILSKFMDVVERPSGIILVTGPTGSGKTTALYSVLTHLNDISKCIIALEQPVEVIQEGVTQISINEESGLTFNLALREVLRQDPDIILVGEIRDEPTAKTAIQASNTGHQVFSTLHTNSASLSVVRLVEMGVEPFMVSSTLNAVMNQRLVRRICDECKEEYQLSKNSKFYKLVTDKKVYRGKGCESCMGTGYKGRIPIQELLIVDNDIRVALANGSKASEIEKIAINNGMLTLEKDGINKALQGLTTLEEIHRIVHFDDLGR